MHLLHHLGDGRFDLEHFPGEDKPTYAILSHTWGKKEDEVTFQDIKNQTGNGKPGFAKIEFCINQMAKDGLTYVWVDTCCIDKTIDSVLSRAIRSMFKWYREAAKCYVYLSDVSSGGTDCIEAKAWMPAFKGCRWFSRGWTLQELIAPKQVLFFSKEEDFLGNKHQLVHEIANVTGISVAVLEGTKPVFQHTYADRMAWMHSRETEEEEDLVYCMLGILGVHISTEYGEGYNNARSRLEDRFSSIHCPIRDKKLARFRYRGPSGAAKAKKLPDRWRPMRPFCRSYEPLVLLQTLGTKADDYVPIALPTSKQTLSMPLKFARRRALEDLAYLCDYDVGNDTVVAMALQDAQPQNVLRIASNKTPQRLVTGFVQARFVDIQQFSSTCDGGRAKKTSSFVSACIEFAASRVHKDILCLAAAFYQCKDYLENCCPEEVPGFLNWMNECAYQETLNSFCRVAYKCQGSPYMDDIARLSLDFPTDFHSNRNPFNQLRRHLVDLGRRFQAAKALLISGQRVFGSSGIVDVQPLQTPYCHRLPPPDSLTCFEKIIRRMHSNQSRLEKDQRALAAIDTNGDVFEQFLQHYDFGNSRPFIHAEVQLIDLFHTQEYSFVDDDRFIACSRPACWSCSTYCTSHPGRFELSSSDQNICLSWRPPPYENCYEAEIEKDRRDALNDFNKRSRREVLHRILKVSSSHSILPRVVPDTKVRKEDQKPTMTYKELVAPLRELCGPRKIPPNNGLKVDSPDITSLPLEEEEVEEVIFNGRYQCNLRQDSCLLETLEGSDSEGGVEIPLCTPNQQAG